MESNLVKISVVMPVYNSLTYLDASVQSVLSQTFREFELLMIDDGSTDGSGEACDRYAAQDPRVRVVHQENSGTCHSRNEGIRLARGKYITFIDNDDCYEPEVLEKSYHLAETQQAQIVKYGYRVEETFSNGYFEIRYQKAEKTTILTQSDLPGAVHMARWAGYYNVIWNGLYLRELLLAKGGTIFEESVKSGYEDWIFNYYFYPRAQKQVISDQVGYVYYQRIDHSTYKRFHPNQLYACLKAGQHEKVMYEELGIPETWEDRSVACMIDLLLILDKDGCEMTTAQRVSYFRSIRKDPAFAILESADVRKRLSLNKRILSSLFIGEHYRCLLFFAKIYYQVLYMKRKRIHKHETRKS